MWFRNVRYYTFSSQFELPDAVDEVLDEAAFRPCGRQELSSFGWYSPFNREEAALTHRIGNCILLCARKEEKVLPAKVIQTEVDEKARQISEEQGRPVNRKEKQNLKEDIVHQLLPQAFTQSRLTWGYIDLDRQMIAVDSSAAGRAEDFLGLLRSSLGSLPVKPFSAASSADVYLTHWLQEKRLPNGFQFGDEAELREPESDGAVLRCKQHELTAKEWLANLEFGLRVTKLGLTWQERLEFIIEDDFALKRVKATDHLMEQQDNLVDATPEQQVDADFALLSGELGELYLALNAAFQQADN